MEQYIIYLGYVALILISLKVFRRWIAVVIAALALGLIILGSIFHADTMLKVFSMMDSRKDDLFKELLS